MQGFVFRCGELLQIGASAPCDFIERTDGYPLVDGQAQAAFNLCAQKQPLAVTGRFGPRQLSGYCGADVRVLTLFDQLTGKREC